MAGLLGLSDQDLLHWIMMQHALGQTVPVANQGPPPYYKDSYGNWHAWPGLGQQPTQSIEANPPLPDANPARVQRQQAKQPKISPQDAEDARRLEDMVRQGQPSVPYGEPEYQGAPAKKRKSMKAI